MQPSQNIYVTYLYPTFPPEVGRGRGSFIVPPNIFIIYTLLFDQNDSWGGLMVPIEKPPKSLWPMPPLTSSIQRQLTCKLEQSFFPQRVGGEVSAAAPFLIDGEGQNDPHATCHGVYPWRQWYNFPGAFTLLANGRARRNLHSPAHHHLAVN